MKIALVYDWVNKIGGAERVLGAIHKIWPEAPLYTAVYNPETTDWAKDFRVIPSFLQHFPAAKSHHEFYAPLMPLAFESFNFDEYEVVISITSAEAKGIITKPGTLHICYCLTPPRYLWGGTKSYSVSPLLQPLLTGMRIWDQTAGFRPDIYWAISKTVARRIEKYYSRNASVLYPPVEVNQFVPGKKGGEDFFLIVSRLVPYKRVDLAITAFNQLRLPLKIIGTGSELSRLRKMAQANVTFLGQLTDKEVLMYYQKCKAVVFPGEEDFGLVPLEAQSCGKPVIAYGRGGALETVVEGQTGEFFKDQTAKCLVSVIKQFNPAKYKSENCRKQAERFGVGIFQRDFKSLVEHEWMTFYKNTSIL